MSTRNRRPLSGTPCRGAPYPDESVLQGWRPEATAREAIDAYDSLFIRFPSEVTERDIVDLESRTGLKVPKELRDGFVLDLDCAFSILAVHKHQIGAPPPHEVRDRMEAIREDALKLLTRLGVNSYPFDMEKWDPTSLDFNRTVLTRLVDAANEDRPLIYSCVRAIGAIAHFADAARIKAQTQVDRAQTTPLKKLDFAEALVKIFNITFGHAPTETANGSWHKFSIWAFGRAGYPIGSNGPRDLLRAIKRNKCAP